MGTIRGVYLAYPIDQAAGDHALDRLYTQIEVFKRMLLSGQHVDWIFDPGDAFAVTPKAQPEDTIGRINRVAHINADLIVAFLPAGVASVGVPMEIDRAYSQGKQVIVFSDANAWMLQLPNKDAVIRYTDWDDESLHSAMRYIAGMKRPEVSRRQEDLPTVLGPGHTALPVRNYHDDAGLDLVVSQDVLIEPGRFADVPCGISVELPEWSWGLVTGRSSALRSRGLLVHSGVIDAGYRGPLYAGAWNMTEYPVSVKAGDRIAQLIILSNMTRHVTPVPVQALSPSERGTAGFGSTGS
jgi:dUTP pyrophosphatase